ncbi:MAG: hypothetical protein HY042_11160 [Spirochaetia bacterium]|nr:hypothetical protein [Spirochaetia bacterium]
MLLTQLECSKESTAVVQQEDANVQVALAYAAKNTECGTTRGISIPVMLPVDKDDLKACIAQIVAVKCADWMAADPTPTLCLSMQAQLRKHQH